MAKFQPHEVVWVKKDSHSPFWPARVLTYSSRSTASLTSIIRNMKYICFQPKKPMDCSKPPLLARRIICYLLESIIMIKGKPQPIFTKPTRSQKDIQWKTKKYQTIVCTKSIIKIKTGLNKIYTASSKAWKNKHWVMNKFVQGELSVWTISSKMTRYKVTISFSKTYAKPSAFSWGKKRWTTRLRCT
jgi:hypothetical protein